MNSPQLLSPIHDQLLGRNPVWSSNEVYPNSILRFGSSDKDKAAVLGIADMSHLPRSGAKGRGTADWLSALGLPIPATPNSWCALPNGGLITRLGLTEFLIEGDALLVDKIAQAARAPGVYPVLRQDASFVLRGGKVNQLLLQTCNVDFRMLDTEPSKVVLTSMAGVGITILAEKKVDVPTYRIWCDGTYGAYLWETLVEIATELGGGCIGLDALQ